MPAGLMMGHHKIKEMKNTIILIWTSMLLMVGACEYKNEEELFGRETECAEEVFFLTDIQPIIQTNCALSGCHAKGGTSPELTSFEKVAGRAADVAHETQSGHMPPASSGKSLSAEEINMISCWVQQGAKKE